MSRLPEIVKAAADPAANNEVVYVADEDMIVHSAYVVFTTDANVATRIVSIIADDGANIFFRASHSSNIAASTPQAVCAFEGAVPALNAVATIPLPETGLRLRKGDRLLTFTSNRQVGDDYGVMRLQIERI